MSPKELRDYIPIMPIASPSDDCIMSKRGDITFGWRIYLPVAFTVSEAGYDSILDSFIQAYKLLPAYCVVHKQDIFRNDVYHAELRGEFLADSYERHFDGRKYLNGYCYLYLTFSSKSIIELKSKDCGFYKSLSLRFPKADQIKACANVAGQFESVLKNNQLLNIVPLKAKDYVRQGEYGQDEGVIPDYLNFFTDHPSIDYPLEYDESYIKYGENVAKIWYIEDSDAYPPVVSSVRQMQDMSSASSLVFLSGGSPFGFSLKIPHIVNRYIVTLPRKAVNDELVQKKKLMNSFSLYSASCRVNSDDLAMYLDAIARSSETTIKCFTDVIAWGKPPEISDIRNNIKTCFSELSITVEEEIKAAPALHYAGIPGAAAELGYDYLMTSEMNGFLCHGLWDGYDFGVPGGSIKVCDRRRMVPIPIDIQSVARDAGLIHNMNGLVVGPSGSGKSFTMNNIVKNLYLNGDHIFIVDIGDSYEGLCRVINEETGGKDGKYNSYDPSRPLSFNPFKGRRHWDEVDEDGEKTHSGMDYVISLIKSMYQPDPQYGWTKDLGGILENFLFQFFDYWDNGYDEQLSPDLKKAYVNVCRKRAEKDGETFDRNKAELSWKDPLPEIFNPERCKADPIFDDFYKYMIFVVGPLVKDDNFHLYDSNLSVRPDMIDMDKFGIAMQKFSLGGMYGTLLNALEEEDIFESRLTVYEVDQIKDNEDLFPIWLLSIMHSFEEKMRTLPCQKVLIIEEAWSAIAKPSMASFITWMWRTARKFNTSAIVVSQAVDDLKKSSIIQNAIIDNSAVKILLDQGEYEYKFDNCADDLALSKLDVGLVLSINKSLNPDYRYKEGFIAIGKRYSNVFAFEVSPEEAVVYESVKSKKEPVLKRAEQLHSYIAAVKEAVQNMKSKKS